MEKEVIIAIIGALAVVGGAVISSGILNQVFIEGEQQLPIIKSLDPDPKSNGENGTTIIWNASAIDPDSIRLLYKFSVKNRSADEPWTVGRDWGTQNVWRWTPSKAGKYQVQVEVRDEDHAGPEGRDDNWTVPYDIVEKVPSDGAERSKELSVVTGLVPDKPITQEVGTDIKPKATTEKVAEKVVPTFFSEEDPAVAASSWGEGRLDLFVIGTDEALYHRYGDGSSWSEWERLGGEWVSAPAAVSWRPDRIDVFALGKDSALWHIWVDGSTWSDWESLGGNWTSAPTVSSPDENVLDVYIRGEDNALYMNRWDGRQSKWGGWLTLGGKLTSAPAAVYSGSSRTDIFAKGTGNTLVHKWWDVPKWAWSDWESLGGVLTSAPAVSSPDENVLDVYIRGEDNALYMNRWDGQQSKWGGWLTLGGKLTSAPAVVYSGSYRTDVFAKGPGNTLVHKWWDVPKWAWSEFETIGRWP